MSDYEVSAVCEFRHPKWKFVTEFQRTKTIAAEHDSSNAYEKEKKKQRKKRGTHKITLITRLGFNFFSKSK